MQQIYLPTCSKRYNRLMRIITEVINHPQRKTIEERIKIINFFDKYGEEPTREAFNKARSTIYLWKKRLREGEGRLSALAPQSTTPRRRRKKTIAPAIREFIKRYRFLHPGVGKETVKPELDEYCQQERLKSVSLSSIGRIIKELKEKNLIPDAKKKLSFYARTGRLVWRKARVPYRKLRRKGYYPKEAGDLVQIDSITIFLEGIKRYLLTAIDLTVGFAFAYCYNSLSSVNAKDFLEKLIKVAPFTIRRIQTDNGSEFEKYFRAFIEKNNLIHFHNYPRHPQSNAHIERFNRILQEQFVNWHTDELYEIKEFNQKLMRYLLWYNTKKPHRRLKWIPPLNYYINNYLKDTEKSNMLWTTTTTAEAEIHG